MCALSETPLMAYILCTQGKSAYVLVPICNVTQMQQVRLTGHYGGRSRTLDKGHRGKLHTHWAGRTVWSLSQRSACHSRSHNHTAFPSITKSPTSRFRSSTSPLTFAQPCQG